MKKKLSESSFPLFSPKKWGYVLLMNGVFTTNKSVATVQTVKASFSYLN